MINTFSIAFYNVENLFDTKHNAFTLDKAYTPDGEYQWSEDRYQRKIQNLSKVISKIGLKQSKIPPVFIGLAEIENAACLKDLIFSEKLKPYAYDFVHYDSPDERGIDVAFLYQKEHFELLYSEIFPLYLTDLENNRDYTRDVLLLHGNLFSESVYIIVNHWPSRAGGTKTSDYKRVKAAELVQKIVANICSENENPKIIIMGDFNDEPNNNSLKNYVVTNNFYNPMLALQNQKKGSVNYRGKWYLFDQIILSNTLLEKQVSKIKYVSTHIFDASFIQEKSGRKKGAPKRTYIGKWHQGGFSDHFPVFTAFQKISRL